MIQLAESLSGYRHLYQSQDPRYVENPVVFTHFVTTHRGEEFSILSRISACGTDYSGRTNKVAHHVFLPVGERVAAGPCALMRQNGFFFEEWKHEAALLPPRTVPTLEPAVECRAETWAAMCGDAGWAGVLAHASMEEPAQSVYVVFSPGMDVLRLFSEAMDLIPSERRWQVTFSTYFAALPSVSGCLWRGALTGSDALRAAHGEKGARLVNLTLPVAKAPDLSPLVACARTGKAPPWREAAIPVRKTKGPFVSTAPQGKETPFELVPIRPPSPVAPIRVSGRLVAPLRRADPPARLRPAGKLLPLAATVVCLLLLWGIIKAMSGGCAPRPVIPPDASLRTSTAVRRLPQLPLRRSSVAVPPATASSEKTAVEIPAQVLGDGAQKISGQAEATGLKNMVLHAHAGPLDSLTGPPWTVPLSPWAEWDRCRYAFYGSGGPLNHATPSLDVDRLSDHLRSAMFDLSEVGLSARLFKDSIVFSRQSTGDTGDADLCCLVIGPLDAGDRRLVWFSPLLLNVAPASASNGMCEIVVESNDTARLLFPLLEDGALRGRVLFHGSPSLFPVDYRCRIDGDRMHITLFQTFRPVHSEEGTTPGVAPEPGLERDTLPRLQHVVFDAPLRSKHAILVLRCSGGGAP